MPETTDRHAKVTKKYRVQKVGKQKLKNPQRQETKTNAN